MVMSGYIRVIYIRVITGFRIMSVPEKRASLLRVSVGVFIGQAQVEFGCLNPPIFTFSSKRREKEKEKSKSFNTLFIL
jgi:hypothetical protein